MFKDDQYLQGKCSGLIADPDVEQKELSPQDDLLVLACDGLWDVVTHQEAVDFCLPLLAQSDDPQLAAEKLAQAAFDKGSTDNITVMIVTLRKFRSGS